MSDSNIARIKDLKAYLRRIIDGVKTLDDVNYDIRASFVIVPSATSISKKDTITFFEELLKAAEALNEEYLLTSTFHISQEDINGKKLASLVNEEKQS